MCISFVKYECFRPKGAEAKWNIFDAESPVNCNSFSTFILNWYSESSNNLISLLNSSACFFENSHNFDGGDVGDSENGDVDDDDDDDNGDDDDGDGDDGEPVVDCFAPIIIY